MKSSDYKSIENELVNNTASNIDSHRLKISYEFEEEHPDVIFRDKVIKELLYLFRT